MHATLCQPTVTVIKPQGHLNATNANVFKDRLTAALSASQNATLLVDLEQVKSLDSSGLMVLITVLKRSRELDCRLSLCSVPTPVQIVFELTQLDRVFEIFDDRVAFEADLS